MLDETNFLILVKDYRQYAKMTYTYKIHTFSHATFLIDANEITGANERQQMTSIRLNNNTSFKGQNQLSKYICGFFHWYNYCYYLNPKKRSANWSFNAEIQNKMNEILKDEKFKIKMNANIKRTNDFEERNKFIEQKFSFSKTFEMD